jgi:hypothetical protein
VLVRIVERVLQQLDVGGLHGLEDRLHLALPEADHGSGSTTFASCDSGIGSASPHIDHDHETSAGVRFEAVNSEALVDGVQEAQVAANRGTCCCAQS